MVPEYSNDRYEYWNTKSRITEWTEFQENEVGTKQQQKTLNLQGRCIVYLFELLCIYTPHVIARHN